MARACRAVATSCWANRGGIVTYDFEVSDEIPASPDEIYAAWMSSEGHSAMTGGEARIGPKKGDEIAAWDGYVHRRPRGLTDRGAARQQRRRDAHHRSSLQRAVRSARLPRRWLAAELLHADEGVLRQAVVRGAAATATF